MHILESPTPAPPLPRCSVFDYLFPSTVQAGGAKHEFYPPPDPNGAAFIDALTGRTITRAQLGDDAVHRAAGLVKLGVSRGDVAVIIGPNSLEWVGALMACQAAGVIVSPANSAYTPSELLHQISDSGASAIFVSPEVLPTVQKALESASAPKILPQRIVLLCQNEKKPANSPFITIEELRAPKPLVTRRLGDGEEQNTAYLCYSSGTTGRAKGVNTTHHNITSQIQALNVVYEPLFPNRDVTIGILPFSHIYGLSVGLHQPLTRGVPVVVLPKFEEAAFLKAVQDYKVTWGLVVPPIILSLLHSKIADKYDISSLRAVQSGAAPLGVELTAAFEKRYGIKITQGYGLTETSPVTNVMTAEESRGHPGQVGKIMPTFQCRLVSPDTGEDVVKGGDRGEMWFRGPSVMKGYWKNEEATANAFAEGGWFKTGDVAVMDEDGYFTIVDRVKELIKYKGFQVAPAELEALLTSHPKVADVAVIGVYDESKATELPRAYITPHGGVKALSASEQSALQTDIAQWLAKQVANHKRLRGGVVFMDTIPKSPSGKILRKDLRVLAQKEMVQATRQAKL